MTTDRFTGTSSAPTRSGWQSYGPRGREHTWVWWPEEYGAVGLDGEPVAGSVCENCGKWDGPALKRGERTRIRKLLTKDNYDRED